MHDVSRVHIIKASQYLIHKILVMVALKLLFRVDQLMQVSLHQLSDDVNIVIACRTWRLLDVDQLNDILVLKEF